MSQGHQRLSSPYSNKSVPNVTSYAARASSSQLLTSNKSVPSSLRMPQGHLRLRTHKLVRTHPIGIAPLHPASYELEESCTFLFVGRVRSYLRRVSRHFSTYVLSPLKRLNTSCFNDTSCYVAMPTPTLSTRTQQE